MVLEFMPRELGVCCIHCDTKDDFLKAAFDHCDASPSTQACNLVSFNVGGHTLVINGSGVHIDGPEFLAHTHTGVDNANGFIEFTGDIRAKDLLGTGNPIKRPIVPS